MWAYLHCTQSMAILASETKHYAWKDESMHDHRSLSRIYNMTLAREHHKRRKKNALFRWSKTIRAF